VRHDHFNARTPERKERCRQRDAELRAEIAQVLESNEWPQQTSKALASWDPYDQNHFARFFDPEWMFGVPVGKIKVGEGIPATFRGHFAFMNQLKGQMELIPSDEVDSGFDIIIGNPPYVRQEKIKELKPQLKMNYECFNGTADLYIYFYERSIKLLRPEGVFSFITSNKWYRSAYGTKLREWLNKNTRVLQLIDFGDAPVFTAISYPTIVVLQRSEEASSPSSNQVRAFNWKPGPAIEAFGDVVGRDSFIIPQSSLRSDGWQLESPAVLRLLDKLRHAGKPLGEYVNGRFYYGIKTGLNEAFVVDRATRDRLIAEHQSSTDILKPFLRGRDVKRWRVEPQDFWLIFTRRGINIKKYPAILEYLSQFKKRLMPGAIGGRKPGSYKWYEIQDNIAYWKEFEGAKIVYPDIARGCEFAFDSESLYPDCTLFLIPEISSWLLAILNSSLVHFFFPQICPRIRGDFMRFKSIYVEQIPIPALSFEDHSALEG
jgi:adenine-specific DNA-methyltransferase